MLLLNKNSKIIGQGITGSEGSTAAKWMKKYGTNLVAGVTPGKAGQEVEGIPIFNTVQEAISKVGTVDGAVQYVPPLFIKKAVTEAIEAGVKNIVIVAEKVPTQDGAYIFALAQKNGVSIIGPSSAGIISPKLRIKIGSIGGPDPDQVFVPGPVAVISKSGGMTSECSLLMKNSGLGVSWAVCMGGDKIAGKDFVDFLTEFDKDPGTQATIIFGELGGTYENKIAQAKKEGKIKKPVVAFIAGEFTSQMPQGVQFGHAGAVIEGEKGLPAYKRKILKESEVLVAEDFDDLVGLVKGALK